MGWEGLNRRQFPRANFPCMVRLRQENSDEDPILTHTENISQGGLCTILKRQLPLFSTAQLRLDLMDDGDVIDCRVKVVWSVRRKAIEEVKPSFYDTGFEFCDLSDETVKRIGRVVTNILKKHR